MAYEPRQQSLAAATPEGRVCVFKRKHSSNHDDAGAEPAKQWEPQQNFQVIIRVPLGQLWLSQHHAVMQWQWSVPLAFFLCSQPPPAVTCCLPQVGRGVTALCWGPTAQLLGVQSTDGLHICTRAPLLHKLCEGFAAIQVTKGTGASTRMMQTLIRLLSW